MMIFIGGAGRSGTTVVRQALNKSSKIAAADGELRFINDLGGLCDLAETLVNFWDPFRADLAIRNFENLFFKCFTVSYLPVITRRAFKHSGIAPISYRQIKINLKQRRALQAHFALFLSDLNVTSSSSVWFGSKSFQLPSSMYICSRKKFEEFRLPLECFLARVIKTLTGKDSEYFIDDTPFSILRARTLRMIFPNAIIVNLVRHPLDVRTSYGEQRWTIGDERDTLRLQDVYKEISILEDEGFIDTVFRYEDLCIGKTEAFSDFFFERCGIDLGDIFSLLHSSAICRYRKTMTIEQILFYSRVYEESIKRYGYAV